MARWLWVLAASVFCWANGDDAGGGEGGLSGGDGGELPWKKSTAAEMEQVDAVDSQGDALGGRWVIYSASTPHLKWSEEDDEPFTVCSLDHVGVEVVWNSSQEIEKSALWELVLVHDDGRQDVVARDIAFPSMTAAEEIRDEDFIEIDDDKVTTISLECEFDPGYCHPELVGIRFPDLPDMKSQANRGEEQNVFPLEINDSIVLEFQAPTNRPEIGSIGDVVAIVDFSEYVGDNFTGSWSANGRILTLRVLDIDASKLKPMQQFMDGLLKTKLVSPSRESRNNRVNQAQHPQRRAEYALKLNFRIERPATYQFVIHDTLTVGKPLLISPSIRSPLLSVSLCDKSDIILQDDSISSALDSYHRVLFESNVKTESAFPHITTPSSLFIPGILTAGGDEGFIVPESSLHSVEDSNKGSWSINFWLFLTEDSTGSFRTLFFHGDGGKEQRTPSVWWKPNERRLVLRVSTRNDPDVGLDSGQELPLREWVHLGFSFYNCSGARQGDLNGDICPESLSHPQSWYYVIELYVNGELDQRVRVHEEVEPNDGPLHIGKGPWTPGMQGFISDLRVYGSPLTLDQHLQAYLADMSAHPSYLIGEEGEIDQPSLYQLSQTPASQIAYIFQRIVTEQLDHSSSVDEETIQSLLSACSPGAIDELGELAERGHPLALFYLGKFHLYGVQGDASSCNASKFSYGVDLDVSKAARFLFAALRRGHLESARYLALALEVTTTVFGDESSNDRNLVEFAGLKLGLYHVAASSGSKSSFAILGHLYRASTVSQNTPNQHAVAAHHYYHAARDASVAFHERGKQPLHEMNRLYDYRDSEGEEDLTARGERGENDELIQYQKLRADQGDVESMAAMGDLYYWGARGVQRDHARAFHYFERAASEGHPNSQCAVANMLLRGEGVQPSEQDNETAISWFNKAIEAENHTRALNGLGYLYFHGSAGLPENKTKALELFDRAANEQRDGDSLFNAGYCYARGIGTAGNRANTTRAIELFDLAARKFGHFDSVMELADIWMHGVQLRVSGDSSEATAIDPDWTRALEYSKAASDVGRWGSKMRTGFSYYLSRQWGQAIVQYHDAQEFGGYPLASSNLAFLYDMLARKDAGSGKDVLPLLTQLQKERRAVKYLLIAHDINDDQEVLVRLGDFYFHGLAGVEVDYHQALDWYSRASARGDDRAAYNVGYMYENGIVDVGVNFARAKRYYERSRDLAAEAGEGQIATIPARLAFYRVMLREWAQESGLVSLMLEWFSTQRKPSSYDYDTVVEAGAIATATVFIIGLAVVARRHLRFLM